MQTVPEEAPLDKVELELLGAGYGRLSVAAKKVIAAKAEALRFAQELGEKEGKSNSPGPEEAANEAE